jgi:hypothetical protein
MPRSLSGSHWVLLLAAFEGGGYSSGYFDVSVFSGRDHSSRGLIGEQPRRLQVSPDVRRNTRLKQTDIASDLGGCAHADSDARN